MNPAHLQESTVRENTLHGNTVTSENLARTHCPQGHELTEANCRPAKWAQGERGCLTCHRAATAKRHAAIRAARTRRSGSPGREYVATYGWAHATAHAILRQTGRTA